MKLSPKLAALVALAVGLGAGVTTTAQAALPAAITTAISGAETDMAALYTALIGVGAAIWVLRIIYRKFAVR